MRRIFWGFCRNWFLMSPLHYLSGSSDFDFEFAEIFVFENDSLLSQIRGVADYPLSPIRGVSDSPYRWYGESPTPRIVESGSRRLPASLICRVSYWIFLKDNSLYPWYGESSTPRTSDTVSRQLPVSLSRRVADSAYRWYREWLFKKKN